MSALITQLVLFKVLTPCNGWCIYLWWKAFFLYMWHLLHSSSILMTLSMYTDVIAINIWTKDTQAVYSRCSSWNNYIKWNSMLLYDQINKALTIISFWLAIGWVLVMKSWYKCSVFLEVLIGIMLMNSTWVIETISVHIQLCTQITT